MELLLYYKEHCPYCQKVLRFMKENQIELPMVEISHDKELQKELMDLGGKMQVPCLSLNRVALYESDDIIAWLKEEKLS